MGVKITLNDGSTRDLIEYGEFSTVVLEQLQQKHIEDLIKAELDNYDFPTEDIVVKDTNVILCTGTEIVVPDGIELNTGDFAILETTIDGSKKSRTAYIYNIDHWEALDGNYKATDVYFTNDLTYTVDIGTYKVPNNKKYGTISAIGKSLSEILDDILAKEIHSIKSIPKLSLTANAVTETTSKEIGEYITSINYTGTYTDGSYSQGTVSNTNGDNYTSSTSAGCSKSNEQASCSIAGLSNNDTISGSWSLPTSAPEAKTVQLSELAETLVDPDNFSTSYAYLLASFDQETSLNIAISSLELPEIAAASAKYLEATAESGGGTVSGFSAESISIFGTNDEFIANVISPNIVLAGIASESDGTVYLDWKDHLGEGTYGDLPAEKIVQATGKYFWLTINEENMGFESEPAGYGAQIALIAAINPVQITETTNTKYATVDISCDYSKAARLPATNLEKYDTTCEQITAGSLTASAEVKITGCRKCFWKVNKTADMINPSNLTSAIIRDTFTSGTSLPTSLPNVEAGTQQLIFLAPKGKYKNFIVTDVTNENAKFTVGNTFTSEAVGVEGANGYTAIKYDMWLIQLDTAYPNAAKLSIERS